MTRNWDTGLTIPTTAIEGQFQRNARTFSFAFWPEHPMSHWRFNPGRMVVFRSTMKIEINEGDPGDGR